MHLHRRQVRVQGLQPGQVLDGIYPRSVPGGGYGLREWRDAGMLTYSLVLWWTAPSLEAELINITA